MNREQVCLLAIGFAVCCIVPLAPASTANASDAHPNIVLVLADDLGWAGLGCYGSTFYETPNIDRLASEGVRFTAAFSAAANCAPSRATIMSGQYTPKHGVLYVGPGDYQEKWKSRNGDLSRFKMLQPRGQTILPGDVQTVAESLKRSGYRTGMFGKWHLGTKDQHPASRGFDVAIESHGKHFEFKTDPQATHPPGQYLSDFLSDQAAAFIQSDSPRGKPFFLYYADFLVHKPFEAKERYLQHFGEKRPSQYQRSPMAAAMIKSLDDSVGKILAALDKSGERDNTLFIFSSDNGGLSYEEDGLRDANTSNLPLRGRKGSEYEGGIRVPWIVRWPGRTQAGTVCDVPIHHVDLFPTLLAVANGAPPPQALHGVNLAPLFRAPGEGLAERNLYWYLPGYSAFHEPSVMVRRGRWKLIRSLESEAFQLFDTRTDISETNDVRRDHPEVASDLDAAAMRWLDHLEAPRMTPNPEYKPR